MLRRIFPSLVILAALGAAILVAGPLHRGGGGFSRTHDLFGGHGAGADRFQGVMADVLGLDDAQQTQIQSIVSTTKQIVEPQRLALEAAKSEIQTAIRSGAPESEVRALATAQADAIAVILGEIAVGFSRAYAVLTPEQQQRAQAIHDRFEERRRSGK